MKQIQKTPIEIFCHDCRQMTEELRQAISQQYCKYIRGTCVKPRKSEPDIKVGICTLGATVNKEKKINPVIICPQRFKEDSMFETIRLKYLSNWHNVKWVQEVSIGVGGNVDYVAVELDHHGQINDFLCVEIQAGGTTGTPYPYVDQLRVNGNFDNVECTYGINWANEFSKTMMQQAYKKGKIIEHWGRKIVFVVQDVAMRYLMKATDCSGLTKYDPSLPVDFCSFSLKWEETAWHLRFKEIKSSSIAGINLILGGAHQDEYPSVEDFKNNIMQKGITDGVFLPEGCSS